MQKISVLTLLFLFAIVISIVAIKQFMTDSTQSYSQKEDQRPDTYLIKANYLSTNEAGDCNFKMSSVKVLHYQYKDSALITKPHIIVFNNAHQWVINSDIGKSVNRAETFYLENNVRVKQLASKNNPETLLMTEALTVFPKKNLATSDRFVTIEQPGLKINAIGLRGNLDTGSIELLSNTRGKYDPKKSS